MCKHVEVVQVGDVRLCLRCGLARLPNGKMYFDKQAVDYLRKREAKSECIKA